MIRADNSNDPQPPEQPPEQLPEQLPEPRDETPHHLPRVVGRDGNLYLSCAEVVSFLYEYLSEELDVARRADFERHLARCRSCRSYLASYRETILLAQGSFGDDEAEPAFRELPSELVGAILAAR